MMRDASPLVDALRDPSTTARLDGAMGSLAHRLEGHDVPKQIQPILKDAIENAALARKQALWEADCARRALANIGANLDCKVGDFDEGHRLCRGGFGCWHRAQHRRSRHHGGTGYITAGRGSAFGCRLGMGKAGPL